MKAKNIFIIVMLIVASILVYFFAFRGEKQVKEEIVNIEKISNYNYTLDSRDSEYMKEVFSELKTELEKKNVDMENYAKLLGKLFIIDFYTLDNKVSSSDVGSVEYVLPDSKDNFIMDAKTTMYKNLELIKKLPVVKKVDVNDVEVGKLAIDGEKRNSYKVYLNWEYEKDYGYDKNGIITFVDADGILYVVEYISGDTYEK